MLYFTELDLSNLRQLVSAGKDAESAYWELVIKDIQDACKLFESIYDQTDGADGYVSVEVSPRLANDTEGTVEAAKWLHKLVNRPNVYIKIPATAECVPSIKEVISLGISVNVTVSSKYQSSLTCALDHFSLTCNDVAFEFLDLLLISLYRDTCWLPTLQKQLLLDLRRNHLFM